VSNANKQKERSFSGDAVAQDFGGAAAVTHTEARGQDLCTQNEMQNFNHRNQHVAETGLPLRHLCSLERTYFVVAYLVAKGIFRVQDVLDAYRPLVVN